MILRMDCCILLLIHMHNLILITYFLWWYMGYHDPYIFFPMWDARSYFSEQNTLKATLPQDIIQFLESGYFFYEMLEDIFQQNPPILKPLSYKTLNSPGCSQDRLSVWPNPFMLESISSLMTCPLSFLGLCANLLTYVIYMQLRIHFTNSWWAYDWISYRISLV